MWAAQWQTVRGLIPATAASFAPPASGRPFIKGFTTSRLHNVTCRIDDLSRPCSNVGQMLYFLFFALTACACSMEIKNDMYKTCVTLRKGCVELITVYILFFFFFSSSELSDETTNRKSLNNTIKNLQLVIASDHFGKHKQKTSVRNDRVLPVAHYSGFFL